MIGFISILLPEISSGSSVLPGNPTFPKIIYAPTFPDRYFISYSVNQILNICPDDFASYFTENSHPEGNVHIPCFFSTLLFFLFHSLTYFFLQYYEFLHNAKLLFCFDFHQSPPPTTECRLHEGRVASAFWFFTSAPQAVRILPDTRKSVNIYRMK